MSKSETQSKHVTKSSKSHVTKSEVVASAAATPEPVAAASPPPAAAAAPAASEPLQARVTGAIALVKQAMVMLAIAASPLSGKQVMGSTKFRKGGEAQIPALAEMSGTYGVEVPSRPTADMEANLAQAEALAPLLVLVARFLTILESATFEGRSEAWATATTLYTMLKKASVREPALKEELAPLQEFFSYRHPLVKETAPQTQAKNLAKETKRQQNAAKKLQRLQNAVAAAGGGATVLSDAAAATPAASSATSSVPPAAQPTAQSATPGH
jgi:hypothetical protein